MGPYKLAKAVLAGSGKQTPPNGSTTTKPFTIFNPTTQDITGVVGGNSVTFKNAQAGVLDVLFDEITTGTDIIGLWR